MTTKFKIHLNSQKIEDRKQRENHFSAKSAKQKKKPMVKTQTHTAQHNGISQLTDLPIYSNTQNLFKTGIFI